MIVPFESDGQLIAITKSAFVLDLYTRIRNAGREKRKYSYFQINT